jgi:hypothetical protein
MQTDEYRWVPWVVGLLGGGAMGAVLKTIFDTYQRRIQPVGYKIQFTKIFKETVGMSSLRAELQVTDGVETRHFQNLFIADITLSNKGNAHIDEFPFGIKLGGDDVAIYIQTETSDRHHIITQITQVALGATAKEIDFVCKPFNRKDTYSLKVFISIPPDKKEPEDISLSTSHPVKFVGLDTYQNFALDVIQGLGPVVGEPWVDRTRVKSD